MAELELPEFDARYFPNQPELAILIPHLLITPSTLIVARLALMKLSEPSCNLLKSTQQNGLIVKFEYGFETISGAMIVFGWATNECTITPPVPDLSPPSVTVPLQPLDTHPLPSVPVSAGEHAPDCRLATSKYADLILRSAKPTSHPLGGPGTYEASCKICWQSFRQRQSLSKHIRGHNPHVLANRPQQEDPLAR
jgi:hypothetical protein